MAIGNIPEVLDNGEVTDGTHVTAGQLALALTPYAQVTDLAVNTAASSNNAGNRAPGHGGGPGHHGRAGGRARKQHRRAAELADHGSLQQGRPVGLRRAGGRGAAQDAETAGAIMGALLAYYTAAQVDALLGDYRTASAGHADAGRHHGRAAGLPDGPGPGRVHNQPNHLGAAYRSAADRRRP